MATPNTHIVIPDVQCAPDTPTDHLVWAGRYIGENYGGRRNVSIHALGDWWHMAALSKYDVGKKAMEGRRYVDDVAAGNEAMDLERASWLLRSAEFLMMSDHWYGAEDDDETEDD